MTFKRDGAGGLTAGQSTPKPPCTAQTQQGAACGGWALPDGRYCHVHEPSRAERVQAARSKGGKVTAIRGRRLRLTTPAALLRFGGVLLQDVLDETVTPEIGRVVFYGLSIQRQLVEISELEQRLANLEQRLAAQQPVRPAAQRWRPA